MERILDRNQMQQYIRAVHRDDDGYITIAAKTVYGAFRQRHCHGTDELLDAVAETYSTKTDIYVSVNSFYLPIRKSEALRRINAIYADIDLNPLYTGNHFEIVMMMYAELFTPGLMPEPSMVVDSGGGIHLYWFLEDLPGQALAFWQAVAGSLISALKRWIKPHDFCKLDAGVTTDSQRVMRLPGTFNQSTGRMCRVASCTNIIYRLDGLRKKYGYGILKPTKIFSPKDGNPYYARLLTDLIKLRDMRLKSKEDEWCRRRMTFYFRHFALLAGFDAEKALEMTKEFNSGFSTPIPDTKIDKHTYSAQKAVDQGKAYRYKIITLLDELAVKPAESKMLDLLVDDMTRMERNRKRRKANYGDRDESGLTAKQREMEAARMIVSGLVRKGRTQAEISKLTGYSLSKVKRLRAQLAGGFQQQHAEAVIVEKRAVAGGSISRSLYVCDTTPRPVMPDPGAGRVLSFDSLDGSLNESQPP